MTEPIVAKIGVLNQGTIANQTNYVTLQPGRQALIYSDPLPDLRFFQGRSIEVPQITTWLADPQVSIVGVRGTGGIGKSTLMAKAFTEAGFTGKFWGDVRAGTSMTLLATRMLQELGVLPEQVRSIEEKDLIPRLLRQLQQGRYLLAIDNLESVLTTSGDWQSGYDLFLDGFQTLGGESVLLLGSREFPAKYFGWLRSRWLPIDRGLEPQEGAALLAALEVEDSLENRAAVAAQVQGNPLALALIAGWLREECRPGERFVSALQRADLGQLVGKHRGEAQISLDRVVAWSVDRLTPVQQHRLMQVSVLRGAFDAALATALVLDPPVSDADLHDLERRSLLQELPPDRAGQRQFRLQPRLREWLQQRSDDLTTAHERAINYFWSQRREEFARDDTQVAVFEYEETFYHCCQLGRYAAAAMTVFACDGFLRRRGYYQTLVDWYEQLYTNWQPTVEERRSYAGVCNNLGNAYSSLGQYQRAIELYEQQYEIAREIGDRQGEANSLIGLGNAYSSLGQYQRAIELHEQSLDIKREIGDRRGEAASLGNLGNAYDSLGQYQRAIELHEQQYEIAREIGDRQGEANSLGNLGNAYSSLGQYQRAIELYQRQYEIAHEIGDRKGEAGSLGNLGNAYYSIGQYQRAIEFQQQSLDLAREIGDRQGEANSLGNLGNAYYSLGQYQRAIEFHQQQYEIACEIGDRQGEAGSLGNLGNAYSSLGQYQRAIELYEQSLDLAREIGDRQGEAASLGNLGNAYSSLGQYQRAIELYEQQYEIAREIGDRWGEGASLFNLGSVLKQLDRWDEALQHYQQALTIYEALQLDHMVERCQTAIANCKRPIRWWRQWWVWFAVGLAIVLIVWKLQQ